MDYKMKVQNSGMVCISEIEDEFQKTNEILIKFSEKEWVENVILSKKDLHKLIGTLLHIQAKMK